MAFDDGGSNGWGGGSGGGNSSGLPPDFPNPFDKIKDLFGSFGGGFFALIAAVAVLLWLGSGFYVVNTDEVGVVKRFGKYSHTTDPGPHWHLPYPIETVMRPKVTQVHRMEVGFETIDSGPPARYRQVPRESTMLTGDENIVTCEFIVQYRIKDPLDFLFKVRDPVGAFGTGGFVKDAAEAAMREIVGRNKIDDVLTEEKEKIQAEAQTLLQSILDQSGVGISVVQVKLQDVYPPKQVIDAFRDVASAREDRETLKNQAEAYNNDLIPKARGDAEQRINVAQAYRETKIKTAEGDAARFEKLWSEYKLAKEVTRKRLYLDSIKEVLSNAKVVIADGGGKSVLPLLPLGALDGAKGGDK
ncbi:MAG: FtsH protease activity modulator HflK [Deltaproteobacteria bacterium]|nr:MAG: FtsH protease activity modulator HflK [Deltaproteobacteria bacterium]